MATTAFTERENFFYKAREDALLLLDHPDFVAPEHPYVDTVREMIDYAVLGIIDKDNGLLHAEREPFHNSVIIVPVLKNDSVKGSQALTVSSSLCIDFDVEEICEIDTVKNYSGLCDYGPSTVNPILKFPYWILDRDPLIVGSALVHETDHAYWWNNRQQMYNFGGPGNLLGRVEMEISAYRLEEQIFKANAPDLYTEEYARIARLFRRLDFAREYKPRENDKRTKAARVLAFTNFMFDSLGGAIGTKPPSKLIRALKDQKNI